MSFNKYFWNLKLLQITVYGKWCIAYRRIARQLLGKTIILCVGSKAILKWIELDRKKFFMFISEYLSVNSIFAKKSIYFLSNQM